MCINFQWLSVTLGFLDAPQKGIIYSSKKWTFWKSFPTKEVSVTISTPVNINLCWHRNFHHLNHGIFYIEVHHLFFSHDELDKDKFSRICLLLSFKESRRNITENFWLNVLFIPIINYQFHHVYPLMGPENLKHGKNVDGVMSFWNPVGQGIDVVDSLEAD